MPEGVERAGTTPESVLVGLWETMLRHRPESASDFFASGGDSMVAMRLTNRVNRDLGISADASLLFDNPRFDDYLRAVTELVDGERGATGTGEPPPKPDAEWSGSLSFNQRKRLNNMARRAGSGQPERAKNVPLVLEIAGDVDRGLVEAALTDVINHQPALRTSFAFDGDAPRWRCVERVDGYRIVHRDLRDGGRAPDWGDLMDRLIAAPIPVERAPLMRVELLTLGDSRHLLVAAVEHMICDAFSIDILRREFLAAHAARESGVPIRLAPIDRHPQRLLGARDQRLVDDPDELLNQWREALDGLDHPIECDLATERPSLALPRPAEHRAVRLVGDYGRQLMGRCAELGCSETAMVLAAVFLTLAVTTGRADVPLVVASARRDTAESEPMMDWFADLVVVRCRTAGDPGGCSIGDVVASVQAEMWAAHRRAVPFNMLLEQIGAVPPDAKAAFPWVFVNYVKRGPAEADDRGPRVTAVQLPPKVAYFHGPSVEVEADGSGLEIRLTFATGRYREGVVDRFTAQLSRTLEAFATQPWRCTVRESLSAQSAGSR